MPQLHIKTWAVILVIILGIVIWPYRKYFGSYPVQPTNSQIPSTSTQTKSVSELTAPTFSEQVSTVSPITSLHRASVPVTNVELVKIPELELAVEALKILRQKNWSGNSKADLLISAQDFNQSNLNRYVAEATEKEKLLTIPTEYETWFSSSASASEIQQLILSARQEYLGYLKQKKVLDTYIQETARILPAEEKRMKYHAANDPNAPSTATEGLMGDGGQKDYSQIQLNVYAVDIFTRFDHILDSQILGELPANPELRKTYYQQARDLATRQLIYHEMTHVLQQAYVNTHVKDAAERTRKSSWIFADKTLIDVDTHYFWHWGPSETFRNSNNRQLSQESQAEGVSFEVAADLHNLSPAQRHAWWAHAFGRLENGTKLINELKTIFDTQYPQYQVDSFSDQLADVFGGHTQSNQLRRLARRLAALPPYAGYLNPMQPQDTDAFWQRLGED